MGEGYERDGLYDLPWQIGCWALAEESGKSYKSDTGVRGATGGLCDSAIG
jgi:hypothetical protein